MKPDMSVPQGDAYAKIGVRPFINCCATRTIHGGSVMLPEVREAMRDASGRFVDIDELMRSVGQRLAEVIGAEWGIVTSGAAAALCHATAACIAGADPEKMLRLPDTTGLRNRVVMMTNGRFPYDHAIRMPGATIVEVDSREAFVAALDDRVAMIAYLGKNEENAPVRIDEAADLARPKGIPILVDAASEHPERPIPYLVQGASLVAYSGGKHLRGPQPTGLLLGERALVEAAWVNSAPHHTFGRAMKLGKEEIMGCLAAVEIWFTARDHNSERDRWHGDLEAIASEVAAVPAVSTDIRVPEGATERVPSLEIKWDNAEVGITGLELRERLLEGEPRIMLDDRWATECSVGVDPFALQPGEPEIVGAHIRDALANAPKGLPAAKTAPAASRLDGDWDLEIEFASGAASHSLALEQQGQVLSGVHRTLFLENPLEGRIDGHEVTLFSRHRFEGTSLAYRFSGSVGDGVMEGSVELGTDHKSARGPVNRREYGSGRWRATRRD